MTNTRRALRPTAGLLAVVVAGVHAYWALPDMARQLSVWQFPDPRPATFLFATTAILMGILLVVQGFDPLPVYVGGMVLMVVFLGGYVTWHTTLNHGAFWPGRRVPGHTDAGTSAVTVVGGHLLADRLALASKLAETALLAVLAVLTTTELRDGSLSA